MVDASRNIKTNTRKSCTCLNLKRDSCFGNGEINLSFKTSDVHVPFNVYNFDK